MDFDQQIAEFIRPRLGARPANQFLRAWAEPRTQLIKRVIEPLLFDPQTQQYICVSEVANLPGRNHRGAEAIWESYPDDIPRQPPAFFPHDQHPGGRPAMVRRERKGAVAASPP